MGYVFGLPLFFRQSGSVQDLGRLIYAKRKLKDYDFVLKEDVNGLLDFLAVHEFTTTGKYYLFDVFD